MTTATDLETIDDADTTVKTVDDIDTDKPILVARLERWSRANGYRDYVDNLLVDIGLADLLPSSKLRFTVDLHDLAAALSTAPATITTERSEGTPNSRKVASLVRSEIETRVSRFVSTIHHGDTTAEAVVDDRVSAVDVDAIIDEWGDYTTPYPAAGSPDVEAFRHTTIRSLIKHAIDRGYCEDVEYYLRQIGLGAYLPPKTKQITISVPGYGTTAATPVHLTRLGEVNPEELRRIAADHIAAQLESDAGIVYQEVTV